MLHNGRKGLTSYSGTTFRVIIRYWHDLFSRSNSGTTFFDGSDTGTTSAFPLRWHFLFFPPPPGCHLSLSLHSLSLHSLSRHSVSRHSVSRRSLSLSLFQFPPTPFLSLSIVAALLQRIILLKPSQISYPNGRPATESLVLYIFLFKRKAAKN